MDESLISKLRHKQVLRILPDGREGVPVTLQFLGELPRVTRPQRKAWLADHFGTIQQLVGKAKLAVRPDSVSVSGQTIEATMPVTEFDQLCDELNKQNVRVDMMVPTQVIESS